MLHQIALRFPHVEGPTDRLAAQEGSGWHVDGLRQGKMHPFSVLFGVALSDVKHKFQGNLTVWPGSHKAVHSCLVGRHGAIDCAKLESIVKCRHGINHNEASSISYDHKYDNIIHNNEPENLPHLGPGEQITLSAGDTVLVHPDLAHTGGVNFGPDIRSMVYFRIKCNKDDLSWEEITEKHAKDMFHDFAMEVQIISRDM